MITFAVSSAGPVPMRVLIDEDDTTVDRPGWMIQRYESTGYGAVVIEPEFALVLEAAPGQFELWHEGDMVEVDSPRHARELVDAAHDVAAFARSLVG